MAPEHPLDRRTFVAATSLAVAMGRLDLFHSWVQPLLDAGNFSVANQLSSLGGATTWINSTPLSDASLKGKVVAVQFCTFTCINWLRTLPYVRAWAETYGPSGLVVIGAHTPEFPFEKNLDNVRRAMAAMKVKYPIAVDNDYKIWRGFNNQYWPALYLLDAKGSVRHQQFGEGEYDKSERMIRQLLTEARASAVAKGPAPVDARGIELQADWGDLRSPENYVGYERSENFSSPGGAVSEQRHEYALPAQLPLNRWALEGAWTVKKGSIAPNQPNGRISYCFHSRDLNLVMGPPTGSGPVRFRVFLDGHAPTAAHGGDIDQAGNGVAAEQRLYQLIRQPKPITDRTCQIEFLDQGAEVFAFTFG